MNSLHSNSIFFFTKNSKNFFTLLHYMPDLTGLSGVNIASLVDVGVSNSSTTPWSLSSINRGGVSVTFNERSNVASKDSGM